MRSQGAYGAFGSALSIARPEEERPGRLPENAAARAPICFAERWQLRIRALKQMVAHGAKSLFPRQPSAVQALLRRWFPQILMGDPGGHWLRGLAASGFGPAVLRR